MRKTKLQKQDEEWRSKRREEWRTLIRDIRLSCENDHMTISQWEQNFIESISGTLNNEELLTPKQSDCLDRIWERSK